MGDSDFVRRLPGSQQAFGRRTPILSRWHIDLPLLLLLMILTTVGLLVLFSASGQNWGAVKRQGVFFLVGYGAMFFLAQLSPVFYRRWSPAVYLAGVALLVAVLFVGVGAKGAQRWLDLPGLPRFQPSEIMKMVMPMTVAWYLSGRVLPPGFKYIFVALLIIGLPTFLVIKEPDLGTSILIATSGMFVLFFAGVRWRYIFSAIALAVAAAWPAWNYVLHDYQKQRILTMLDPESDKLGAGWNIIQSKTAIGSGGLEGKGWMQGTQSQLDFLPESHTDFIIAVLAEELGLFGVLALLSLYLLIIGRGLMIASRAQDTFGRLLAGSLTMTFFVYVAVNMGMVSGLLPVVGVPLPLVSQGGTAVVTLMAGFGCVMAISTEEQRIVTR
ncbi:MAG: rod shape-determining protein RodA [Pseudomonadales bacterium]